MHRAHLSPGHCLSNGSHYVVEKSADQLAMYPHQTLHRSRRSYPLLVVAAVVAFKSLAGSGVIVKHCLCWTRGQSSEADHHYISRRQWFAGFSLLFAESWLTSLR